jgi:hypothetical protein
MCRKTGPHMRLEVNRLINSDKGSECLHDHCAIRNIIA